MTLWKALWVTITSNLEGQQLPQGLVRDPSHARSGIGSCESFPLTCGKLLASGWFADLAWHVKVEKASAGLNKTLLIEFTGTEKKQPT